MCGLNFSFCDGGNIERMNGLIAHRGIRKDVLSYKDCHFGHVRLPIQGLGTEYDQPYYYKEFIFLFAGEIFNFKE